MTTRPNPSTRPGAPIEAILGGIATRSDLALTEGRLKRRIAAAMLTGMAIVAAIAASASVLAG